MKFFFHENSVASKALFARIAAACEGLVYVSETDSPVTAFAGEVTDRLDKETILHHSGRNSGEPVSEITFDDFFGRLTAIKEWYGERETERAKKFLELQKLLEEDLRELKVFKVGNIRVDIFAAGIDKEGYLMGVTAKAVET